MYRLTIVTMISSAPEVQYVALRNISLILQKQPDILSKEWRIFVYLIEIMLM
jgi:AP-1 complex subunit beta-1